jgi:ABC transport system ATP-binding/permease protein
MAERLLVSLDDVALTFGGKPLFEELRLHVCESDKICLVGRNGAGKTTLMRLITGELEVDAGSRFILPGLTVGYLAQKVAFNAEHTVHEFVLSGLRDASELEYRSHLADMVIAPLDLIPTAKMGTLSGGQLRRAALARALIEEPDLLMLDEPTNHLDIAAIEWLEDYLRSYRGALICVSHDRAFLAAISQKVFWIDHHKIRICPHGYKGFEDWAEQVVEQEARELHNMQKKLAAEMDWTQGGVSGRRKRNQRRLNELFRLRDKLKNDKAAYNQRMRTIDIDPITPVQASKIMAEFKHVSKSFTSDHGKVPILDDFNFRILRGDRIGIVGRNGSGKSSFIKMLTNDLEPDSGRVFRSKNMELAYFDQNRVHLNPNKTLWDTLCPTGGDYVYLGSGDTAKPIHVCGYLKNFLFDPRMARDRVSTLSGGQQNRLMLAKLMTNPGNLLILDEPTNDLDMDTLDMLQDMLADYAGTLIIVSHDRDFLDRTVTEILAFEGNAEIEGYIGGYSDYHAAKHKRHALAVTPTPAKQTAKKTSKATLKSKISYTLLHELEQLPGTIQTLESTIQSLNDTLLEPNLYMNDPKRFDDTTAELGRVQKQLEKAEARWLELEQMKQESEAG